MKRMFAAVLAFLLIFSVSGFVFAAETEEESTANTEETTEEEPTEEETTEEETTEEEITEEETTEAEISEEETTEEREPIKGDADADGVITAADARLVLRAAVELETFSDETAVLCDMDEDALITAADARLVLRLAVGLPLGETERERIAREAREEAERKAQEERERLEKLLASEEGYMQHLADSVSEENLKNTMHLLVREIGTRYLGSGNLRYTGNQLVEILKGYGYSDVRKLDFSYNNKDTANILAVIPTAVKDPDIILFVAHYDTVGTTAGAVDNSSGVAVVLELARILIEEGRDFGKEVRILFSSAEENGYVGCYRYVSFAKSALPRHVLVFNLDMAGKPNYGEKWYLAVSTEPVTAAYNGHKAKENIGSKAVDKAKALLGDLGEYKYVSPVAAGQTDIVPFRKNGVTSVNVSWRCIDASRSHGSDLGLASPSLIHTEDDSLKNFDMQSLYNTCRLVAAAAGSLLF